MKKLTKFFNFSLLIVVLLSVIIFYLVKIDIKLRNIYSVGYFSSLDKSYNGPLIFPKDVKDYINDIKNQTKVDK